MFYKNFLVPVAVGLLVAGCSNSPKKTSDEGSARKSYTEDAEGRSISNAAAVEANAYNFVEIEFAPGTANLTASAKASLDAVLVQAHQKGVLDEAIVLSWADQEYPSNNLKKLSKRDRELADKRGKSVKDYVVSMSKIDVDTYNMAVQPNAVSKWFNTTDSRLKNSLMAAGLPTTADDPQYPSKAFHSVILVKVE